MGRPPDDLVAVVTKIALGSPAVTTLRALRRSYRAEVGVGCEDRAGREEWVGPVDKAAYGEGARRAGLTHSTETDHLLEASARVALGFRSLFNLHDSVALLRSLSTAGQGGLDEDSDAERYWEVVLDYCVNGNMQALLDEYIHILETRSGLRTSRLKWLLRNSRTRWRPQFPLGSEPGLRRSRARQAVLPEDTRHSLPIRSPLR